MCSLPRNGVLKGGHLNTSTSEYKWQYGVEYFLPIMPLTHFSKYKQEVIRKCAAPIIEVQILVYLVWPGPLYLPPAFASVCLQGKLGALSWQCVCVCLQLLCATTPWPSCGSAWPWCPAWWRFWPSSSAGNGKATLYHTTHRCCVWNTFLHYSTVPLFVWCCCVVPLLVPHVVFAASKKERKARI